MIQEARNTDTDEGNSVLFCKFEHSYEHKILQEKGFHEAAPKNKWDWGFMAKKSTGGRKFFYFILFFIFLTVYVCTYIY